MTHACPEWHEHLLRLRDGSGDAATTTHVEGCDGCRTALEELSSFEARLRGPDIVTSPSPQLRERLHDAFLGAVEETSPSQPATSPYTARLPIATWVSGLAAVFLMTLALIWVRDAGQHHTIPATVGYTLPHRGVTEAVESGSPFHLLVRTPESAAVYVVSVGDDSSELLFPGLDDDGYDYLGHASVFQPAGSERLFPDPSYGALVSNARPGDVERYLVVALAEALTEAEVRRLQKQLSTLKTSAVSAFLEHHFSGAHEITVPIE